MTGVIHAFPDRVELDELEAFLAVPPAGEIPLPSLRTSIGAREEAR